MEDDSGPPIFEVVFDRDAEADLLAIRNYIAEAASPRIAEAYLDRLLRYCEGFTNAPYRGTAHDGDLAGVRTVGWARSVTIAFRVAEQDKRVIIAGVFYRGRDTIAALRERRVEGEQEQL